MAGVTLELPDTVVLVLSRRARAAGMTLGASLRSELERSACRPEPTPPAPEPADAEVDEARTTAGRAALLAALEGATAAATGQDAVADELRSTLRMLTVERSRADA